MQATPESQYLIDFPIFGYLCDKAIDSKGTARLEVYTTGCSSHSGNNSSGSDTRLTSGV